LSDSSVSDLEVKAALAKSILDDVVESSSHEDEKVGRMLYSMSFLTVGAAIAFSSFLGNRIGNTAYGVDLMSVLFLAYLAFLVAETIIVLEAMSPRLHVRGRSARGGGQVSSANLDSMHFFKSIARKGQEEWPSYFRAMSAGELLEEEREQALRQAHFLARKVTEKIEYIRKAKWIMLFAALSFVAMVVVGVLSYI
jgi:hypothetical protein